MFLYRWPPDKCSRVFEDLARKLFAKPNASDSMFTRVRNVIKCFMADGQYDSSVIEDSMKGVFGSGKKIFGPACNEHEVSGMKVAVTATSLTDASCFLFTNYNANDIRRPQAGMCELVL
jgi:hypothetical protein